MIEWYESLNHMIDFFVLWHINFHGLFNAKAIFLEKL